MDNNTNNEIPVETERTYLHNYKDLAYSFYKGYDLYIEDNRSIYIPDLFKGKIIGVTMDKILVRRNNNITAWYPLNHSKVLIFM